MRDSAAIDGANDVVILLRIILPLSKALLAVFALFSIVGHWNSWFPALIYLRDSGKWPVQMLLRRLVIIEDFFQSGWKDAGGRILRQDAARTGAPQERADGGDLRHHGGRFCASTRSYSGTS